jgi:hypothetical protein
MLAMDGAQSAYVPLQTPPPAPAPAPTAPVYGPYVPKPDRDVHAAADRVMNAGDRSFMKDDYEKRMDVFAQEMAQGNDAFRAQLVSEILQRDHGAFGSWLHADRLQSRVDSGHVLPNERDAVVGGFRDALMSGAVKPDQIHADFVRDLHDPALISTYMKAQDPNDRGGFERSLQAFSGVNAKDMGAFTSDPDNADMLRTFTLATQHHQDWYENQTVDTMETSSWGWTSTQEAPVSFSKDQLSAMRDAFKNNDLLMTDGELLLAYPDRQERNEAVTKQYEDLSKGMASLTGGDNANWATFAVAASDEIGRNLKGTPGIAIGEAAGGDPRYWLSVGNSQLVSDIGPAFQYFNQTFQDSKNHNLTFDQFYQGLQQKWGGRGISYLDGHNDPQNNMKNAFKAYYDAMKLHDQEMSLPPTGAADNERASLADQRSKLMLYANTLVGLQEQNIAQPAVANGMTIGGGLVTNPLGRGAWGVNLHLLQNKDGPQLNTDRNLPNTPERVSLAGGTFTTVDGKTINLDQAIRDRLNGLDGNPNNEDETNPANSGTNHWEQYSQRMGYIYQLFADYQRDPTMFNDPRQLFGSRAQALNNDPVQIIPGG